MIKQLLNSVTAKCRDLSMSRRLINCSPLTNHDILLNFIQLLLIAVFYNIKQRKQQTNKKKEKRFSVSVHYDMFKDSTSGLKFNILFIIITNVSLLFLKTLISIQQISETIQKSI